MAEIIWDSELGPSWPSDWSHTTVHAQFVAVTGDGADSNRLPDIAPSGNGEVIFTPSLRTVRYVGADGPYVVSLKQYRAVVDSEGYLCTPDTFGQPGERGIVLPSTDAPVIEPRGEDDNAFTWRVDFDIPAVNIRSDHISVPVGGPYDLVDLLSPERAAGVVHLIDRVSARYAIEAAQEATAARDLVLPARDETLEARDQAVAAKWLRGALSSSDNIDSLYAEDHTGGWRVETNTVSVDLGLPVMSPGILEVTYIVGVAQPSAFQTWRPRTGSPWERVRREGAWSEWTQKAAPQAEIDNAIQSAYESVLEQVTPPLDVGYTGVPNSQLQDAFRDAYPLVSTGGKGVVCLRWDHGLTNFKDILQPLHEQYEIPGIIAMNSRNWDLAENSGMTKAEAAALAADGLIEWANHGADDGAGGAHRDESTREGIWDQIYNGRVELENEQARHPHDHNRTSTSNTSTSRRSFSNGPDLALSFNMFCHWFLLYEFDK